ncbi:substrate-binding periplasmic protein [Aeromonas sp. MdU4]|uniref:substrate-binding periplasmic protein n=1 Tax=Aeromonas sp. MdU4 TaxID=3342819 RepID=UPI0035BC23DE
MTAVSTPYTGEESQKDAESRGAITMMAKFRWLLWFWCSWLSAAPLSLVSGDFAPYSGADLPDGGQSTRLVTRLLKNAGYRDIKVEYLPWVRGYQQAENGLATATYPYAWTEERARDFYYSSPIHIDNLSWFTYHGRPALLDGQWQGAKFCVPQGWSTAHADHVIKRFGLILQRPRTLQQCLQLLARQRVDLVAMNDAVMADVSMQEFGDPCYLQLLPYFRQLDVLYLIVSRRVPDGPALLDRFNNALAASRSDGSYQDLMLGSKSTRCKMWPK